jgi:hypothetical protein
MLILRLGHSWLGYFSSNKTDDIHNTEIAHEQLFFEDEQGGNAGFFDDNLVRPDNPLFLDNYRTTKECFDDELMREAFKNVIPKPYSLLGDSFVGC